MAAVTGTEDAPGVVVTAEGVETDDQYQRVVEIGCNHAQGFYYFCPLSGVDLSTRLAATDSSAQPSLWRMG